MKILLLKMMISYATSEHVATPTTSIFSPANNTSVATQVLQHAMRQMQAGVFCSLIGQAVCLRDDRVQWCGWHVEVGRSRNTGL